MTPPLFSFHKATITILLQKQRIPYSVRIEINVRLTLLSTHGAPDVLACVLSSFAVHSVEHCKLAACFQLTCVARWRGSSSRHAPIKPIKQMSAVAENKTGYDVAARIHPPKKGARRTTALRVLARPT